MAPSLIRVISCVIAISIASCESLFGGNISCPGKNSNSLAQTIYSLNARSADPRPHFVTLSHEWRALDTEQKIDARDAALGALYLFSGWGEFEKAEAFLPAGDDPMNGWRDFLALARYVRNGNNCKSKHSIEIILERATKTESIKFSQDTNPSFVSLDGVVVIAFAACVHGDDSVAFQISLSAIDIALSQIQSSNFPDIDCNSDLVRNATINCAMLLSVADHTCPAGNRLALLQTTGVEDPKKSISRLLSSFREVRGHSAREIAYLDSMLILQSKAFGVRSGPE